jgi:hypothetical protein
LAKWRRARSELDLSHEQIDCVPGEICFDSVSYEGARAIGVDGFPGNFVDSVELGAVSDLECDSEGWRWSSSNSDSEIANGKSHDSLQQNLAKWSVECNVTHSAVGALLKILKPYHPSLPLDPRILLKTSSNYNIKQIEGGEYCHIGIERGLQYLIGNSSSPVDNLELQINVDGIPLFESSSVSLWPILCLVRNIDFKEPAVIGLFCGKQKLGNAAEFLSDSISDMLTVMEKGLYINEKIYSISVHSFVCDAPARVFLKGIKSHSGYSSCENCTVYGEYDGKVFFSSTSSPLRTDDSFDKLHDENHHIDASCPLSPLPVGCVSQFGLDYKHLTCLGIMRRLLLYWKGPVGPLYVRLGRKSVLELSRRLMLCAAYCPVEFARKPRTLDEVNRWKATEFREFLLYYGPFVLHEVLSEKLFSHFMLLFVGIRILASRQLAKQYCDYANELLVKFVTDAEILYGREIMVYNVHCLIHLAADVKHLGCLDEFSAFPFENKL